VLFILLGAPGVIMTTAIIGTLHLSTPETDRGRAFAALGLSNNVGQAIGMLAAGALTAPLGLTAMLNAQAVLYLAAGAIAGCSMTSRVSQHRNALPFHRRPLPEARNPEPDPLSRTP
jgi:MFS family permease